MTSINTISQICEVSGGNVDQISKSIGLAKAIGPYCLNASVGCGGYCLEKDTRTIVYLAKSLDLDEVAEYWTSVVKFNRYQMKRFGLKIIEKFDNCLKNKKILFLGAAFKGNVSDCRNTPLFCVLEQLLEEKGVHISIYDPLVKKEHFKYEFFVFFKKEMDEKMIDFIDPSVDLMKVIQHFDGIALVTDHSCFKGKDEQMMEHTPRKCLIFDGRRILQHESWKKKGYEIYSIGIYEN